MSNIGKLFKQSSNYFLGQILLMAASFASFPLYTRLLSVSDYGIFSLTITTVALIVAFSKLGIQNSLVRFYSNHKSNNSKRSISQLYSTIFFSILFIGGLSSLLFFLTLKFINNRIIEENSKIILSLASILIVFYCVTQIFNEFFRVEQKPKINILFNISSKYGSIFFSVVFYLYLGRVLYNMVLGIVIWEGILFIFVCYIFLRLRNIYLTSFSWKLFKDCLKYGFPLIGSELSFLILQFGDRYLIQYYMGSNSLGIYSAGYSMATYAAELLTLPVKTAIMPIYMNVYFNQGEEELKYFLGKSFKYFFLIAIPVTFGFNVVSSDLILLLASKKYLQSTIVIPYIITGLVIYGTWCFFGAGLFIHKKTYKIMVLMVTSCILNIGLNFILIPRYGIIGAAIATLFAYIYYIILLIIFSFRKIQFKIYYKNILKYLICGIVMYAVISNIFISNQLIEMFTKIIVGTIIYSSLVIMIDKEIKHNLLRIIKIVKSRNDNLKCFFKNEIGRILN